MHLVVFAPPLFPSFVLASRPLRQSMGFCPPGIRWSVCSHKCGDGGIAELYRRVHDGVAGPEPALPPGLHSDGLDLRVQDSLLNDLFMGFF